MFIADTVHSNQGGLKLEDKFCYAKKKKKS